jgi:hypothetical protein
VAGSEADVLSGSGALYVFASAEASGAEFLTEGQSITGHFVRVANPASLSSAGLQTAVDALGAFKFVRLEDVDYDPQTTGSQSPAIYFVDTGSEGVKCGTADCDPMGSIDRMDLNASDPTQGAVLTLLQRSRGAPVEFASPDNIAVGKNSIMVQEDPAYPGFVRAPRIWQFHTNANRQLTDRGTAVVELPNANCSDSTGTCWESSGIIDASADLGAGVWLFDIQAHTLAVPTIGLRNEGGQLLALRLPGS